MSTINRTLADKLVEGNGKCKEGSAGYVLVRYQNRTKYGPNVNCIDPDAKINCFDYAIFANRRKYEEFMNADTVGGVDILWASERFKKDEKVWEEAEEAAELYSLAGDLSDLHPEYDGDEDVEIIKPGRKERL